MIAIAGVALVVAGLTAFLGPTGPIRAPGEVRVGDTNVLTTRGPLSGFVGRDAVGTEVEVRAPGGSTFWVGQSDFQRVLVSVTGAPALKVLEGDLVWFSGVVRRSDELGTIPMDAETSVIFRRQRAYIRVAFDDLRRR